MMDEDMNSINHQRRHVLKSGLSLGIGSLISTNIGFTQTEPLHFLDATEQAKLIRTGQVSVLEMVTSAIERIELLNPNLNAVVTKSFEQAIDSQNNNPNFQFYSLVVDAVEDVIAEKETINITLKFTSEQFRDNDESTIIKKQDVWTFEKHKESKSPIWTLVAT